MSFFSKQNVNPRRRSSSAVRSGSSTSSYNRPRSMGHYTNPYSSPYSSSTTNPYSSFSTYSSPSSNYQSPYYPNGYRGATSSSGYASLKIPAKNLLNLSTPNSYKKYDSGSDSLGTGHSSRSRDLSRAGSYRDRSLSRSRSSLASGMGSRSISLTSLNSEGYIVSRMCKIVHSFIICNRYTNYFSANQNTMYQALGVTPIQQYGYAIVR